MLAFQSLTLLSDKAESLSESLELSSALWTLSTGEDLLNLAGVGFFDLLQDLLLLADFLSDDSDLLLQSSDNLTILSDLLDDDLSFNLLLDVLLLSGLFLNLSLDLSDSLLDDDNLLSLSIDDLLGFVDLLHGLDWFANLNNLPSDLSLRLLNLGNLASDLAVLLVELLDMLHSLSIGGLLVLLDKLLDGSTSDGSLGSEDLLVLVQFLDQLGVLLDLFLDLLRLHAELAWFSESGELSS